MLRTKTGENITTWEPHLDDMGNNGEWGGQTELAAIAPRYNLHLFAVPSNAGHRMVAFHRKEGSYLIAVWRIGAHDDQLPEDWANVA